MKKTLLLFVVFFSFFCVSKASALDNLGEFTIQNFDVGIKVWEDATFSVEERIEVEFTAPRHGIFREIPYRYKDDKGFNFKLRLDDFGVYDGQGRHVQFTKYKEGNNLVLKIGDPDKLIEGENTYIIKYEVRNGLRFFEGHSELYWNPIGTEWPTTIASGQVHVRLFRDLVVADNDLVCFTSFYGSTGRECSMEVVSSNQIDFVSKDSLDPYEGLTIGIRFPDSFIRKPTWQEAILFLLMDNWGFVLPFAVFGAMFILWAVLGREIDLGKTTIVQYEAPDRLTPGEVGFLIQERYSADLVSADIVNLAVKGYVKIVEAGKSDLAKSFGKIAKIISFIIPAIIVVTIGFVLIPQLYGGNDGAKGVISSIYSLFFVAIVIMVFVKIFKKAKKTKDFFKVIKYELQLLRDWRGDDTLTEHEKKIAEGLFGKDGQAGKAVKLDDLKDFYQSVTNAGKEVKKQMDVLDYFEEDNIHKKTPYIILGIIVAAGGIMFSSVLQRLDIFLGFVVSAGIIIGFGLAMSRKTLAGAEALRHAKGLKQYIYTAERYRVKFQEDEHIFEKILPYAMVFGMADKWANAFENIYNHDPQWYSSQSGSSFRASAFGHSIGSSFAASASAAAAPPSSSSSGFSGGGSSGGGGGGGGGGSW